MKTHRERINLAQIRDNPWQPRDEIDPDALRQLADGIERLGLMQAPLGRWVRDDIREVDAVELAFGHRRVAALQLLADEGRGDPWVDMDVADLTDEEMALMGLSENLDRVQLSDIETIRAHKRAIDETDLTVQQLADGLGRHQSTISNNLRILALPDFVLAHVETGDLKPGVAREFLCLQGCADPHIEEMRSIVNSIAATWRSSPPDWRRKNVRAHIQTDVARNEVDYRPLGKGDGPAGAARQPSFDADEFIAEHPKHLHLIPNGETGSRMWTCAVKDWTRAQTAATGEANKAAAEKGIAWEMNARDTQLEKALAKDPVFQGIKQGRSKTGPNRPLNEREQSALGTRAELKTIGPGDFHKVLDRATPNAPHELNRMRRMDGPLVPPWFPDLDECKRCTIGAAYAKSRHGYPLEKPTLVCLNEEHYLEKLKAGEAEYRAKFEADRAKAERRDREMIDSVAVALGSMPEYVKRPLATALVQATERLQPVNPLGFRDETYSYPTAAAGVVGDLIKISENHDLSVASVDDVAQEDLSRLIAILTAHHLRIAGRADLPLQMPIPDDAYELVGA